MTLLLKEGHLLLKPIYQQVWLLLLWIPGQNHSCSTLWMSHSASTPIGLYHCKQLAEPFLNVQFIWSRAGFCVYSDVLCKLRLVNEALPTVATGKGPLGPVDALVPQHVSPFPEVLVTVRAVERPLPCVQALMAEQLRLQAETLVTLGTLKRLLSRVRPDVFDELRVFHKALAALTGERHLPAVQQLVGLHVGLHAIALVTLRTLEGPLSGVQALVAEQLPLQAEAPVALWALEGSLPAVHAQVLRELGLSGEALATLPTRERPLLAVRVLVGLQDALQAEALVALQALERPLPAVHPQVLTELALVGEASATLATGERPLPAVPEPVGSQHALQAEAQPTLWALKGLLVRVQPLVPQQLSPLTEVPATLGTPERLLSAVDSNVLREFTLLGGALATFPAAERSLPTVRVLVDLQQAAQAETLVAMGTLEGLFSSMRPAVAGEGARRGALPTLRARAGRRCEVLQSLRVPLLVAALLLGQARACLLSGVHTAGGPAAFSPRGRPLPALLAPASLRAVHREGAHAARGALGRLLPLVREAVAGIGLLMSEAHFTVSALEGNPRRVGRQMGQQTQLPPEALGAHATPEVPLYPRAAPRHLCLRPLVEFLPGPMWSVL